MFWLFVIVLYVGLLAALFLFLGPQIGAGVIVAIILNGLLHQEIEGLLK